MSLYAWMLHNIATLPVHIQSTHECCTTLLPSLSIYRARVSAAQHCYPTCLYTQHAWVLHNIATVPVNIQSTHECYTTLLHSLSIYRARVSAAQHCYPTCLYTQHAWVLHNIATLRVSIHSTLKCCTALLPSLFPYTARMSAAQHCYPLSTYTQHAWVLHSIATPCPYKQHAWLLHNIALSCSDYTCWLTPQSSHYNGPLMNSLQRTRRGRGPASQELEMICSLGAKTCLSITASTCLAYWQVHIMLAIYDVTIQLLPKIRIHWEQRSNWFSTMRKMNSCHREHEGIQVVAH